MRRILEKLREVLVVPVSEPTFDQASHELIYCRPRWRKTSLQVKFVAFYRVSPISSITHLAEVVSVSENEAGTQVYRLRPPIPLTAPIPKNRTGGIQGYKYTTLEKLMSARGLDDT